MGSGVTPGRSRYRAADGGSIDPRGSLENPIVVAGSSYLFAAAGGLLLLGRRHIDANWDLLNYHVASAYLLFHDSAWQHVRPSGVQTYFSPFVNVPTYLGLMYLGPIGLRVMLIAWQALVWALLVTAFWDVLRRERIGFAIRHPEATLVLLVVLAGMGNLNFSVLGTSYTDLTVAVFVAAAFALVQFTSYRADPRLGAMVGMLLGVAVGLKLTALVTVVPFLVALYATRAIARGIDRALLIDLAAGVLGFAITAGVLMGIWMVRVAAVTGNPVFPYLNSYFQSPFGSIANWSDRSFIPATFDGWLWRPAGMALGRPGLTTEVPLRDVRWLILLVIAAPIGAWLGIAAIVRRGRAAIADCPGTFLIATWSVLTLVIWSAFFFIGRYIPVTEMAIGFLILRSLLAVDARWSIGVAAAAAAATLATFAPPNWGSRTVIADGTHGYADSRPAFHEAFVVLAAPPMGWTLPYLGDRSRTVLRLSGTAAGDGVYGNQVARLIRRAWPDGMWLLSYQQDDAAAQPYLRSYDLTDTGRCRPVATWYTTLWACRLIRDQARPPTRS